MNRKPPRADGDPPKMALAERQHRPKPKREGPNRAVLTRAEPVNRTAVEPPAPADAVAAAGEGAGPGVAASAAPDDGVIGAAVAAAYRVVEDNVQEGRRAAERLRAAAGDPSEGVPNTKAVAGRLVHITRDLGAAWVDLIAAVLREPEVRAVVDRITLQDRQRPPAAPADRVAPVSITQRVRSRKPLEVTLSALPPLDAAVPPGVAGLHALGTASPPLLEISFAIGPAGALELQIAVPDEQPADVYTGTVVDIGTRLPIGALTVRVLE
jgi:hypothetical protein